MMKVITVNHPIGILGTKYPMDTVIIIVYSYASFFNGDIYGICYIYNIYILVQKASSIDVNFGILGLPIDTTIFYQNTTGTDGFLIFQIHHRLLMQLGLIILNLGEVLQMVVQLTRLIGTENLKLHSKLLI